MKISLKKLLRFVPLSGLTQDEIYQMLGLDECDYETAALDREQAEMLLKIFSIREVFSMLTDNSRIVASLALCGGM